MQMNGSLFLPLLYQAIAFSRMVKVITGSGMGSSFFFFIGLNDLLF